uniref:BPI fold-containing family A member 1 n=1 Tax=Chinchilla lanigera TaxID=34839 RepID=A0A8C2W4K1_CHILA
MFQIGGLIVLCGLLAQSTAQLGGLPLPLGQVVPLPLDQGLPLSVTPAVPLKPKDPAGSLNGALTNGLLSGGLLGILENLPLLNILKPGGGTSGGLIGGLLGTLTSGIPLLNNIIELVFLTMKNPSTLECGGTSWQLGCLLCRPMITSLLELNLRLNVTAEVLAVRDNQGRVHLVLGDCIHSPGSLHISLLKGVAPLPVQGLLDGITDILNKVLPELVQGKVCPLVNEVLSHLDVTLVHDIAGEYAFTPLLPSAEAVIPPRTLCLCTMGPLHPSGPNLPCLEFC